MDAVRLLPLHLAANVAVMRLIGREHIHADPGVAQRLHGNVELRLLEPIRNDDGDAHPAELAHCVILLKCR